MVLDTIYCLGLIQSRSIDILEEIGTRGQPAQKHSQQVQISSCGD